MQTLKERAILSDFCHSAIGDMRHFHGKPLPWWQRVLRDISRRFK